MFLSFSEHVIFNVLKKIQEARLKVKLSKCIFTDTDIYIHIKYFLSAKGVSYSLNSDVPATGRSARKVERSSNCRES